MERHQPTIPHTTLLPHCSQLPFRKLGHLFRTQPAALLSYHHRFPRSYTRIATTMAAPTDDISSPLPNSNSASPSGPAPAGAGTKRKRATEPKFYAVKAGFQPGVYYTWNDCLTQVTGYKGAVCKSTCTFFFLVSPFASILTAYCTQKVQSFPSLEEANSFLTGQRPLSSGKDSNSVKPDHQRFYAIQRGRKPGVYTDWASAQEQIWRFQKPRYRKFSTRAEAEQFVKEGQTQEQKVKTEEQTDAAANGDGQSASTTDISNLPGAPAGLTADRPRDDFGNVLPPGTAPLPPGALDGFDPNVLLDPTTGQLVYKSDAQKKATKLQPKSGTPGMLNIYTDGSSLRNGSKIASAGVGVYFGPQDDRYGYLQKDPSSRYARNSKH